MVSMIKTGVLMAVLIGVFEGHWAHLFIVG